MTLEELGILLEDYVNAERRKAVALEEIKDLLTIAVEAYAILDNNDDEGETEVSLYP